jgi:hypothetical protein
VLLVGFRKKLLGASIRGSSSFSSLLLLLPIHLPGIHGPKKFLDVRSPNL